MLKNRFNEYHESRPENGGTVIPADQEIAGVIIALFSPTWQKYHNSNFNGLA